MNEVNKAIQELENYEVEIVSISEGAERQGQDTSQKVNSGFEFVDDCIDGGFREGDFNIVTGIPGEGKTTLCRMFTLNFAKHDVPSLWFSYEMTLAELWDSFEKMGAEKDMVGFAPFELDDDLDWMFRHIDKAITERGVKAVFIDTLGDVVKSVKTQQEMGNYANYLAQICKDLRSYAIKNNIMIFAVAHAVKNTRTKSNETENADIANSNGIPAQATNIFHVWRSTTESDETVVKIGKSRRDGTKKNWRVTFKFNEGKLLQRETMPDPETTW
jgi:predicted ATP-dependent serine protease